ncbi:phosphoenolpyruvate carboxylase [Halocatena pleomorpha]|uniref:phosphoenolpyruvate carboxylase n=1 Tax=Halocatena pleomorpha TaxID=1785090 RepID=A0A3P3R2Y5_9EURY|nr:phosphoenolpyruvate carboxylase [Halocatena pleomorpha]RRJ27725.1 phosphoenolpyruvate carboxylase [Halocatena pleomorpha]
MALHSRDVRQDVRELGALLGEVLESQASEGAFDAVESLRTTAIDYRRGERESRAALHEDLMALAPERRRSVARAFTTYFELINLAEERERIRSIRSASQNQELAGSFSDVATALNDVDESTVQQIVDDVLIEPTFTAHPTEARRKTIKAKLRSIESILETLDERTLTDIEREHLERELHTEVTSLWQTAQVRSRRPTPDDEAHNVQWYLEHVLFDVVGDVYTEFESVCESDMAASIDVPKLFEFRSWAGSDRDGNPHVTPEVTSRTLARQREIILERYQDALDSLRLVLSHDRTRLSLGPEFRHSLEKDREELPQVADTAAEAYSDEPYRQKIRLMSERLDRIGDVRPGGYPDAAAFAEDLTVLTESVRNNGGEAIVESHLAPLQRQVDTFDFTLASLDLRDHRENHTATVGELLQREGVEYENRSESERVELLTDSIIQAESVIDLTDTAELSETAARVCERFVRLADWQAEYGSNAIDTYCISMTEQPSHVLEVLFLADQADVVSLPDYAGIDVVPLLETKHALSNAREIMGTLFENEAYAQALSLRGDTQEIMLGYSDSNKENGFLAANWALYRNQRRLGNITEEFDIDLRLFHGRGGSISRGGGPMNEALLALPPETVTGEVKFTEQGEAIAEKYANPRIAERNLEQMLTAQLRARLETMQESKAPIQSQWVDAMETMADTAREAYQDLLTTDGFVSYFEQATPIPVIETLNLGSRPASRSDERSVEDLRAIPWVFSWTQSRCILPGWYGLATGIESYLENGNVETLQEMYEQWPFFRTTLDNAALAIARTDLEIAAEYADLADDELRDRIFPLLSDEHERARELVLTITNRDHLIDREWLRKSLKRRNPYVDPLNLLQVQLLGTDPDDRSPEEERALRLTVNGIAAGMQNTG